MNTMTTIEQPISTAAAITCNTTKTYLFTKEVYLAVKAHWVSKNTHSAAEHIGYNLIRGFEPTRGFTPIKSQNKIDSNCGDAWNGYNVARDLFNWTLAVYTEKYANDKERIEKRNAENAERFKKWFGMELTEELRATFPKLEKMK